MASQTEREFAEFNDNHKWNDVFQRLKNEADIVSQNELFSLKRARDQDCHHKNRYKDVSPYDHSRIKISGPSDYINASLIEVPIANRKYILTQGPLDHTMGDFWQMTWEQGSKAIVMLNKVIEKGSLKCSQYWPLGADYGYDQEMYFEEYGLRVTLIREHDFQHFTLRTLELEHMESGDKREVLHFHYMTWPDFGVPSSPIAFLHFLHSVRQTNSLDANVAPAIIHCSAGIGRSGTFCLVDSCLVTVEACGNLGCINVQKSLIQLRSYRMGLIQTSDQLRFSYHAIIEGAHIILTGGGLGNLQLAQQSVNESQNYIDGRAPQPPERSTSLHPAKRMLSGGLKTSNGFDDKPPVLPPKTNMSPKYAAFKISGEKVQVKSKATQSHKTDDEDIFREGSLVDNIEILDDFNGRGDMEEELRAAHMRHEVRESRKKQTLEKIQQMKEKQRKSERWRGYQPFIRHSFYFGLAMLVGVAAIVGFKLFW